MIALIQRVQQARVVVAGETIGAIEQGMLAFIGVTQTDTSSNATRLLQRLLSYRIFEDEKGRMNRALPEIGGGLLLVPQFTLAADTQKGTRPSFSTAAPPDVAHTLFHEMVCQAQSQYPKIATGRFGADMKVHLVNDGPVTFWLNA